MAAEKALLLHIQQQDELAWCSPLCCNAGINTLWRKLHIATLSCHLGGEINSFS